jgi:hypothetical protein
VPEAVVHRPPHEGLESLGRSADALHQLDGDIVEGDEERRGEVGSCVVERPLVVLELEGDEAQQLRQLTG